MFQQYAGYFWAALFAALVLYSLWRAIGAPFLVRRFYLKNGFADLGESTLDVSPYDQSLLLRRLSTKKVYAGNYKNLVVKQFEAGPDTRGKFTMSQAQRTKNKVRWTISLVELNPPLPVFCARPTRAAEAIEYLLGGDGIDFPEDEGFSNRVHVISDDARYAREVMLPAVREHLTGVDPVSLESTGDMLILKSPRQPHDVGGKLLGELDGVVGLCQLLRGAD